MTTRRTLSRVLVGTAIGTLCALASGCIGGPSKRSVRAPSVSSVVPGGENEGAAAYRNGMPTATGGGPGSSIHPGPAPEPVR
jgi:hypothetical protein